MWYRDCVVVALSAVGILCGAACAVGGGDGPVPVCGDRRCDEGENATNCPTDCPPTVCGDGVCSVGETTSTCPADCYCGNGTCDSGEDAGTCVLDCGGSYCGDGVCNGNETAASCPADCGGSYCGDGTCDADETAASCPADCGGSSCGDGTCDAGETAANCPADCGSGCIDPICDLWPQCGCQPVQKCTIDGANNHACMTAGNIPHGQTCATDTECAAGTICVGTGAQDLLCYQFCVTNNDCPGTGGGGVCVISLVDANQQPIPGAMMCTLDCNPASTSPAGCPTGWACHLQYVDDNNDTIPDFYLTDCANDAGTSTTTCDNVTTFCAPGYFCYADGNECIRNCRVGLGDCPPAMTCYGYTDPAVVGTTEYGYCQ